VKGYAFQKKPGIADTTHLKIKQNSKSDKSSYLKSGIKVALPPLKPASTPKPIVDQPNTEKLLADVEVYPNPVSDQLNLTYTINKNANVTIKIMDVLGNEVTTLLSQRVDAGPQKKTFSLSNKLSSGFYFLRLVVGTESVIKRISVL
jgi:hypothetical protein